LRCSSAAIYPAIYAIPAKEMPTNRYNGLLGTVQTYAASEFCISEGRRRGRGGVGPGRGGMGGCPPTSRGPDIVDNFNVWKALPQSFLIRRARNKRIRAAERPGRVGHYTPQCTTGFNSFLGVMFLNDGALLLQSSKVSRKNCRKREAAVACPDIPGRLMLFYEFVSGFLAAWFLPLPTSPKWVRKTSPPFVDTTPD